VVITFTVSLVLASLKHESRKNDLDRLLGQWACGISGFRTEWPTSLSSPGIETDNSATVMHISRIGSTIDTRV
jgi:hypothetical protein